MKETALSAMIYPDISTNYSMARMCNRLSFLRVYFGAADNVEDAE
jgi:hypothetical protein